MTISSIKGFRSDTDSELIRGWYKSVDSKVKAAFDVRIKYLSQRKPQDWGLPFYRALHGECAPLGEIRFKANKLHYRPIGIFSGKNEFTILFFATEKGGKFVPKTSCKVAQKHMDLVKSNKEKYTHEWRIDS